jgi:hypothetical protein
VAYNTKAIKTDLNSKPIPQYYNTVVDEYQVLQGTGGATWVTIYDGSGNAVSVVSNKLAVRATEIEDLLTTLNSKDFATQTTLAAVLAKIIAAPATEAKQDSLVTLLNGGLPAALSVEGGVKAGLVDAIPAGTNRIGKVQIDGNDTMLQGNITLDGTAQQLSADTASKAVTVQAHPGNNGYVYVGKSDVDDTAYMAVLTPGSSISVYTSNLNKLYIYGTSGDLASFGGEA